MFNIIKHASELILESVDESTRVSQSTFEYKFETICKPNLKIKRQEEGTKENINSVFLKNKV